MDKILSTYIMDLYNPLPSKVKMAEYNILLRIEDMANSKLDVFEKTSITNFLVALQLSAAGSNEQKKLVAKFEEFVENIKPKPLTPKQ